jgi:hydrogenase expression/formation protein HypC
MTNPVAGPTGGDDVQVSPAEHCVTCSDIAVEVSIVRLLDDGLAIVDTGAGQEEVSIGLVSAEVGDAVLVHAGEAIAVVERKEA